MGDVTDGGVHPVKGGIFRETFAQLGYTPAICRKKACSLPGTYLSYSVKTAEIVGTQPEVAQVAQGSRGVWLLEGYEYFLGSGRGTAWHVPGDGIFFGKILHDPHRSLSFPLFPTSLILTPSPYCTASEYPLPNTTPLDDYSLFLGPTSTSTMPLPVPPGAWGLSEEAAYAGPTETVDRQTGKPSTTQSRLRRAHGTDERYPPKVDGELVITRDRVGTIPLPRLPALLHPLECHHPLHASALRLRSHAYTTLEQYGVRWESCHVGHRAWRFDRRELDQLPIAVVMWVSREGLVSDYPVGHLKAICREVRRYAEKTFDLAMNVEIADPGTIRAPSSFPLFPTDPIVLGWSEIRPSIALLLLKSEATSMKPIRRGKEPEAIDNPQTIFISIPEHSKQDWVAIRDAIVYILDKAGLQSVAVEVSRGTSSLRAADYHGTPLPDEIWGKAPISGASVGSHGWERASSSTLGGFVEVRDVDGKWTKYGVTCYHSVLPPKPADGLPLGFTSQFSL